MKEIDFDRRRAAVAERVDQYGFDAYIGCRQAALHYLGGVFMPWRGMVIVTRNGDCRFLYWEGDVDRVRTEGPPMELVPYGGAGLISSVVRELGRLKVANGRIGADFFPEACAQLPTGALTAGEYILLCRNLPRAAVESGAQILDDCMLIKKEAELERLRKATEIGDYGFRQGLTAVKPGSTENHIAGVIEAAIRDKGGFASRLAASGTEVGAGERTAFLGGITTIASERRVQENEFVILDLHPTYDLYCADISIPVFLGKPGEAQKRLIECWEAVTDAVFHFMRPGVLIRDVVETGLTIYRKYKLDAYCVPSFGHGLGVCTTGPILRGGGMEELRTGMVMAFGAHLYQPGVGGMRLEYPVLIGKKQAESLGSISFGAKVVKL